MQHKGYNEDIVGEQHKYGFGGKEEQRELGLAWLDLGARNYDAALGRWMNIDPLAEAYYGINPYAYVFNNPAQLFDPDGMRVRYVKREGQDGREFRQARREFKKRNRQLSKESATHNANFKQLKGSKNTHSISFIKTGDSQVKRVGKQDRANGNDSNININLNQLPNSVEDGGGGGGNEFVIAHEVGHAIAEDNGLSDPKDVIAKADAITHEQKASRAQSMSFNSIFNEREGSHVENVVRGEVSNSRGLEGSNRIPLRETYTYDTFIYNISEGIYYEGETTGNVIRRNYDYYKNN